MKMSINYGVPYGYDMLEVSSSPAISKSVTFSGDINFHIQQPSENVYIVGKQSYISVGLQIVMTREDNSEHPLEPIINAGTRAVPTAVSIPYICPNPAGALFQNVSCSIKGE